MTWWMCYNVGGQQVRESTRTRVKAEAERILRRRLEAADTGAIAGDAHKTTLATLKEILKTNYQVSGRDVEFAAARFKHLIEFFGEDCPVRSITKDRLEKFQAAQQQAGAKNATINRYMAALRRAFRLAKESNKVEAVPTFPMLSEHNTRTGFFEREAFEAVRAKLPEWLRPLVTFQYFTGWRTGETVTLQWKQVDRKAGVIRLEPGTTKNREGRTLPYHALPELAEMIEEQWRQKKNLERERGVIIPWVFHRDGRSLISQGKAALPDVYKCWRAACVAAGHPGRILHDFRRTAVRNLERAGVSRSVAMKITGHKTESVYKRYAIVNEADIAEGLAKVAALPTKAQGANE
jgi:integrase